MTKGAFFPSIDLSSSTQTGRISVMRRTKLSREDTPRLSLAAVQGASKKLAKACFDKKEIIIIIITGACLLCARRSCNNQSRSPTRNNKNLSFFFPNQGRTIVFSWPNRAAKGLRDACLAYWLFRHASKTRKASARILLLTYCYCYYFRPLFFHSVDRGANDFFLFLPSPQIEEKCWPKLVINQEIDV